MAQGVTTTPPIPLDVESSDAREIMRLAIDALGAEHVALAMSFSAEDMVVLGLFDELGVRPRVFTIDTGRLPRATLDVMEQARRHFKIDIEVFEPDPVRVDEMVSERGRDLFYRSPDDRHRCCDVRRVEPLARALAGSDGWVTGLRRDQTPSRLTTPKAFLDPAHGGIWKIAPLADWTTDDVWRYINERQLPHNKLYDEGYQSIGCDPCTRAVLPGADPRSGRWWWEAASDRECGMHVTHESH
jgi:phosphoadenosine phosphosulfate reductase